MSFKLESDNDLRKRIAYKYIAAMFERDDEEEAIACKRLADYQNMKDILERSSTIESLDSININDENKQAQCTK